MIPERRLPQSEFTQKLDPARLESMLSKFRRFILVWSSSFTIASGLGFGLIHPVRGFGMAWAALCSSLILIVLTFSGWHRYFKGMASRAQNEISSLISSRERDLWLLSGLGAFLVGLGFVGIYYLIQGQIPMALSFFPIALIGLGMLIAAWKHLQGTWELTKQLLRKHFCEN